MVNGTLLNFGRRYKDDLTDRLGGKEATFHNTSLFFAFSQ